MNENDEITDIGGLHKFLNDDEKIENMMNNLSLKNQNNSPTQFNRHNEMPQTIPEVNEEPKFGMNSPQYDAQPPQQNQFAPPYGGMNTNNNFFQNRQQMNFNNPNPFGFGMMNDSNFFMQQQPQQFPQGMDFMLGMGMANKYGGMGGMNMNPMNNMNGMGMFMNQPNNFQMPNQFNQDPYGQFNPMYGQGNRMMQNHQMKPKKNNNMMGFNNNKPYGSGKKGNNKNYQKGKNMGMLPPQNNMMQGHGMNLYMKSAMENPTFEDVYAGIPDICKDHMGSKIFQKVYEEESTPQQKQQIIDKILPEVYNLSKDVFGNYVIQHLLEIVSPDNRKKMILELYNKIKELTLHMYGCRVIQKAIDVGDIDDIREHLNELIDELIKCVQDQNGNHVIQKLIEKLPLGEHGEIIKAVKNRVFQLSVHQYGCRAIQRIFEYCTEKEKNAVLKEIYPSVNELCIDQYGNYVIQNIIEKIKNNQIIYDSLKGKIYEYSIHKYASNVIEKCLALGKKDQIGQIVTEIIEQDNKNNDVLLSLVRDKFGNYVVQKMIEVGDMKSKEILVKKIVSSQVLKKRDGFSKHVISMIEKLGLAQLLDQDDISSNYSQNAMINNGGNANYYKLSKQK